MAYQLVDLIDEFESLFQFKVQSLPTNGDHSITPFQAKVLLAILLNNNCSQQKLVFLTGRDKAYISRTISKFDTRGYISRTKYRYNGRAQNIQLSDKGREICVMISQCREQIIESIYKKTTFEEKRKFHKILEKTFYNNRRNDQRCAWADSQKSDTSPSLVD